MSSSPETKQAKTTQAKTNATRGNMASAANFNANLFNMKFTGATHTNYTHTGSFFNESGMLLAVRRRRAHTHALAPAVRCRQPSARSVGERRFGDAAAGRGGPRNGVLPPCQGGGGSLFGDTV